jgi:hypothetical protein
LGIDWRPGWAQRRLLFVSHRLASYPLCLPGILMLRHAGQGPSRRSRCAVCEEWSQRESADKDRAVLALQRSVHMRLSVLVNHAAAGCIWVYSGFILRTYVGPDFSPAVSYAMNFKIAFDRGQALVPDHNVQGVPSTCESSNRSGPGPASVSRQVARFAAIGGFQSR